MVRPKIWPIMNLDNDDCLSVLFRKSLSAKKRLHLCGNKPQWTFMEYIQFGYSSATVPTLPSVKVSRKFALQPLPPTQRQRCPSPLLTIGLSHDMRPRATDRPEPKPTTSDQVCELATLLVPVGLLVKHEGLSWSPNPSTTADDGALIDWNSECFLPVSFPCTKSVSHSTILLESAFPPSPESPVSTGSTQYQGCAIAEAPSPAFASIISQVFSPVSAVSLQFLLCRHSPVWSRLGPSSHQLRPGMRIPLHDLRFPSPGLHLCLPILQRLLGSTEFRQS